MNSKPLIWLAVLAVFLRLFMLVYVSTQEYTQPFPLLELDAREYYQIGQNLAEHGQFSQSPSEPYAPDSFRTPVYPFLIALSLQIFNSFYPILILQALLAALTVLIVYRLSVRLLPGRWPFVPATLVALDPIGIVYSNLLMTETLFLFLLTLALLIFTKSTLESRGDNRDLAWVGILLGLATLTRPISLFLPFLLALLCVI